MVVFKTIFPQISRLKSVENLRKNRMSNLNRLILLLLSWKITCQLPLKQIQFLNIARLRVFYAPL